MMVRPILSRVVAVLTENTAGVVTIQACGSVDFARTGGQYSGASDDDPQRMADKTDKQPGSAPGAYYVDTQCIDCDVCRDTAPDFFTRNDDDGFSYVFAQPASAEDIELCEEALQSCPVDAIGNDGE